ncbi:hypothetical protein CY35_20G006300 [Sphagnum magellanicum]|nr:hypothetical protein CY35_20G006300 [Sphagnum magellanicum]
MTLAGFDGFRIHKSDQSFLFLGDGSEDGKFAPGTLCVLTHKDKEVSNALKGAGIQPLDAEIVQEVAECHGPICTGENLWPRPLGGAKRKHRWLVPGRPRFMTCTMCRWVVPNTLRFGAMDAVVESNPLCSFPISPSFFFLFFAKLWSSFIYHVNALSLVFLNNYIFL